MLVPMTRRSFLVSSAGALVASPLVVSPAEANPLFLRAMFWLANAVGSAVVSYWVSDAIAAERASAPQPQPDTAGRDYPVWTHRQPALVTGRITNDGRQDVFVKFSVKVYDHDTLGAAPQSIGWNVVMPPGRSEDHDFDVGARIETPGLKTIRCVVQGRTEDESISGYSDQQVLVSL